MTTVRDDSLDVFRGATVAAMILVNNPGTWAHLYAPLAHADWHGWTLTDLVFPFFLFAVGNALALTTSASQKVSDAEFRRRWLQRTLLIFGIGLLLNAWPRVLWGDIDALRVMGVLQRIALCWAIAALVIRAGGVRAALGTAVVLLVGYWLACIAWGRGADPYSLEGFFGTHLDRWVLGETHLYRGEGVPFDPEGLGSTLPAVAQVLLGYVVAAYWLPRRETSGATLQWVGLGAALVVLGLVGSLIMPINKKIWTSPYVLLTVGWDLVLLSFLIFVIEVAQFSKWTYFFQAFGRNPLILYVCSGLVIALISFIPIGDSNLQDVIYAEGFTSWLEPKTASFLFAIAYMLLIWSIGFLMDKNKIYIKV
mgnify:CR=1 FL=1